MSSTEPVRVFSGLTAAVLAVGHNTAAPVQVFAKDPGPAVPDSLGARFRSIKNLDAAITVYIAETAAALAAGAQGAAGSAGWPLSPGETMTFAGAGGIHVGSLWAVGVSGNPLVSTLTF